MAESTKVISLRISQARYNQILIECSEKNINITQWFETKIAIAENYNINMENLENQLLKLVESYERNPEGVRWRFRALLRKVSG